MIRVTWETRKVRVALIALLLLRKDKAPRVELSWCRQVRLALAVEEHLTRQGLAMWRRLTRMVGMVV